MQRLTTYVAAARRQLQNSRDRRKDHGARRPLRAITIRVDRAVARDDDDEQCYVRLLVMYGKGRGGGLILRHGARRVQRSVSGVWCSVFGVRVSERRLAGWLAGWLAAIATAVPPARASGLQRRQCYFRRERCTRYISTCDCESVPDSRQRIFSILLPPRPSVPPSLRPSRLRDIHVEGGGSEISHSIRYQSSLPVLDGGPVRAAHAQSVL